VAGRGNKAASVAAWCPAWYAATSTCYLLILALYAILPAHHAGWLWRLTLAFGAVPALLIIAVRSRYISESPVWAANQGDLEGAARILKRSWGVDAVVERDDANPAQHTPRAASWRNYGVLFNATYRRRTILAATIGAASSFGYNAIIFGLPVIIASFFKQGPLTTIVASLLLNLLFAFVGGLIGVRTAPTIGAWKMTVAGHALQVSALVGLALIGHPSSGAFVALAILLLGAYLFGQGFGPGSHSMTYASLSYLTAARHRRGVQPDARALVVDHFAVSLSGAGGGARHEGVLVIAVAPLTSLLVLLAIRWEPSGYDIDGEDYTPQAGDTARRADDCPACMRG
jgi:hypothetical protein